MKMGNRRQTTAAQQQHLSALPALIAGFIIVCMVLPSPANASYRAPIMRDGEGRQLTTGDSGRSAARPPVHRFVGGFIDDSLINRDDRLSSSPSYGHDHARKHHRDGIADRGGCCDGTDVISTEATTRPDHHRGHTPVEQRQQQQQQRQQQQRQQQRGVQRTTGPVHTYIKTDKNGHFKWGVRHFVGSKYAR